MGNKMSAVLSELHFPCFQECLEEKNFHSEKKISLFSDLINCGSFVEKFDGVVKAHFYVSRKHLEEHLLGEVIIFD